MENHKEEAMLAHKYHAEVLELKEAWYINNQNEWFKTKDVTIAREHIISSHVHDMAGVMFRQVLLVSGDRYHFAVEEE